MKKKIVSLLLVLLFGTSQLSYAAYSPVKLYDDVWRIVEYKYVDQDNNAQEWDSWRHKYDNVIVTQEDAYVAIDTMLASLNDPYTRFLPPDEFKEENESIKGTLNGIGIQISVKDNVLTVIAPIEDTPAEKAGLKANDKILKIDGASTKGMTTKEASDKIRGKEGTQVKLLIKRGNEEKTFVVTRAVITLKAISAKPPEGVKIDENLGYIRLSTFLNKNATKEMTDILGTLSDKEGYILDLRSNPGGLLTNAILISDLFLNGGRIVSTVDRDGYKETQEASEDVFTNKPLVILINEGSASASEILSGALKDNKRAVIVGTKSFGKGLVQEINKLPDGSGVNVTIQKYLTPNGTDINKKGITPDVEVKITEEDVKKKVDPQIAKAQEVLQQLIEEKQLTLK